MSDTAIFATKTLLYKTFRFFYAPSTPYFTNKIADISTQTKLSDIVPLQDKTTSTTPRKKPNPLTYIRVIAVLAVITLHSSGESLLHFDAKNPFDINYVTGVFFYSFLRWATPFFILISGTLMLNAKKRDEDTLPFLKKRVSRILIPFVFWALIYYSYENRGAFLSGYLPSYVPFITRFFFEEVYYHLWFIQMILGLYILTPFLRVFLKSAKKSDIEYFLAVCFIASAVQNFYPTFFVIKYIGWFSFIGYYLLGHYLSTYPIPVRFRKWLYIGGILSVIGHIVGTLVVSNWQHAYYDHFFMYVSPTVIILTVALFTFLQNIDWQGFANKFPNINKVMLKINELSFGIYFIHVLILDLLKNGYVFNIKINYTSFLDIPVSPPIGVLATAFFVAFFSFLAIWGLQKWAFLRRFLM